MKRTPLARKTPLRRTQMRRRPRSTKYSRRERDMDYMGFIKKHPCCLRHYGASIECATGILATSCSGPVEADHMGRRGVGQKASDMTCAPLCRKHHRERTGMSGSFRGCSREAMRAWCDAMIERYNDLWKIWSKIHVSFYGNPT